LKISHPVFFDFTKEVRQITIVGPNLEPAEPAAEVA